MTATRAILISIDGLAAFYWTDPAARMEGVRALAKRGVVAARMETVFPSTTWPAHASLVTGVAPDRHGVVGNAILNRRTGAREDLTGDPVYDAPDLLRAPTVYDCAHAAGLTTAAIDWPATRHAPSLNFNLPFFKDQRVFETQTSRAVWTELAALGYPLDRQGEWAELPKRFLKDAMVAELAAHVWRRHEPRLMLLHFLCVDSLQHLHGPRSPEAYWAIDYVDGLIGRFLATLPADELAERTALFVVSDHGFLPVAHEVRPNARLRQLGVLRADPAGRVASADARFVTNHGAGARVSRPWSAEARAGPEGRRSPSGGRARLRLRRRCPGGRGRRRPALSRQPRSPPDASGQWRVLPGRGAWDRAGTHARGGAEPRRRADRRPRARARDGGD